MVNVNKLFPRLPIRAKLAVAFAVLATVPLLVTGAIGTKVTVRYIESSVAATLAHDLQTAAERTERFLSAAREDVFYLSAGLFGPSLTAASDLADPDSQLAAFLRAKPHFIQIKLFDPDGQLLRFQHAVAGSIADGGSGGGGAYYTYRARALGPGDYLLLPVEIRGRPDSASIFSPIPAIAVICPLHDQDGELVGVVVAEAYASKLFMALETGSPQLAGVTGLVGSDGRFLYHSQRKSDWSSLLTSQPDLHLASEFDSAVARQIISGESGRVNVNGDRFVSFAPIHLHGGVEDAVLFLYRSVPISAIKSPARRFLWGVGTGGLAVLAVALTLAVLAATHFTRPIYALREGARRIAAGDFGQAFSIETNDELEDLAGDFEDMASRLREHTQGLEDLVASRTAELRAAHAELQDILAHSEDAIIRLDPGGNVRIWNQGAEKLFGYTAAEAIGCDLNSLLLPPGKESRREAARIIRELKRSGSVLDLHTTRMRKNREPVEVSLSQTVIRDASGNVLGCTLIIRDVTRQKALEQQMLISERLVAAGRLAAGIAHEINNPIGIVLNRLEYIELEVGERSPEFPMRHDLEVIRQQTERVGEVARRLLSLARDEPEVRQPLDLNELVGRVIHFLEPTLEKKALRIELDLATDLGRIYASPQGLETVVVNLLLNAADASDDGGVITVRTSAADGTRAVELNISDVGKGIPDELLERIFEPFFTTKEQPRGTGLGLAVTRSIVHAHGGVVTVKSEPMAGSVFSIRLPFRPQVAGWKPATF